MSVENSDRPMALELSSYFLREGTRIAMAFAHVDGGRCETLSVGLWRMMAGALAQPERPLILAVKDVPTARRLLGVAQQTLPHADFTDDDTAVLALDGDLAVSATRSANGVVWVSLGWSDGEGLVAVPEREFGALDRLLADALDELARLAPGSSPSVTH